MSRPLMKHGVGQLEALFENSKADQEALKQLEVELKHRQVPRAVALLGEVQAAIYTEISPSTPATTSQPTTQPSTPVSNQSRLFDNFVAPNPVVTKPQVMVHPQAISTKPPSPKQLPPTMPIPTDDAYKLLKATPGSTWDSIEQARRLLVQQAHPSRIAVLSAEKRAQVEAEALRVNTAYLALSALRCRS